MQVALVQGEGEDVAATEPAREKRWRSLGGKLAEFLVVGGFTLFLFPLSWLVRKAIGLNEADFSIGFLAFYAAYVINDPHFTVTYLLFYRGARKRVLSGELPRGLRVRWWIAGVVVPIVLVGWAVFALVRHSAQTLGWMVQLMYLTVGWHYVKQGFGMFMVLSARHGARIQPRERLIILVHCFTAWAFAWANPAVPAGEFEEHGVVYSAIPHPRWFEIITGTTLALSTLALVVMLVVKWRRARSPADRLPIAPFAGLVVTIWSWTIFSSFDPLVRYVIPALHSIQYLYFVWLMKRNEARSEEGPPNFGRPVAVRIGVLALSAIALGWFFFKGLPEYLDGMLVLHKSKDVVTYEALGETPYFAAIFVIINIHHYFMDNVIWRRDNPDTRWLREPA